MTDSLDRAAATIESLARSLASVIETLDRRQREDNEWLAAVDDRLGRLSKVVADHEERLTAAESEARTLEGAYMAHLKEDSRIANRS